MARRCLGLCFSLALFGCFFAVSAQNTVFTYQGNLKDGVNPASGNFHFEFSLFDSLTLGNQVGTTIIADTVAVSNGVFAVNLDFDNQFNGANRYLEIKVRPTSGGVLTPLSPRVPLLSTPYAIRAANSGSADSLSCNLCITNAHIVSVAGSKLTGTVDIANGGTGSSTKNFVDLTSAQTVAGIKTFAGSTPNAELVVTNAQTGITDPSPTNLPPAAIRGEATGASNSTIGIMGVANSVGGVGIIGITNGTGDVGKGGDATGVLSLALSPTGETRGLSSQVISPDGIALDMHVTSGGNGYLISSSSGAAEGTGSSTTQFTVNSAGKVFANGGMWAKGFHLNSTNADLLENGNFITNGTVSANGVDTTSNITVGGQIFGTAGTLTIGSNLTVNGTVTPQMLSSGNTQICTLTGSSTLRFCTSSLRYKMDIHPYARGLDIIRQLKPISFNWKENGTPDLGLGAEDVAKVEPLLTFQNTKGEIEGVRYNQMNAVFVNAFKEQQVMIEAQAKLIADQGKLLTRLSQEVNLLKRKVLARRRH